MSSTDSDQPVHQPCGMYAQYRLRSTCLSALWHVCPVQTQINLSKGLVACMPSTDSDQPVYQLVTCMPSADSYQSVHQPSGMYVQYRLRSTCPSALWHVCPVQTQINMSISLVACMPSTDSDQPVHQPSGMYAQFRLISTCPSA